MPQSALRPEAPTYTGLISVDHSGLFLSWLLLLVNTVATGLVICVFLYLRRSLEAKQTRSYWGTIGMEERNKYRYSSLSAA
jgi:hypothetical protein